MDKIARLITDGYQLLHSKPLVSLALACIAIDATSKKHYLAKYGSPASEGQVGIRYKDFVKDYCPIIVGTGKIKLITRGELKLGGITIEDIIYKLIRCSLLHEGETTNIEFTESKIGTENGTILLPDSVIEGLLLSVVLADVNNGIKSNVQQYVDILNIQYELDDVWGRKDIFYNLLSELTSVKP